MAFRAIMRISSGHMIRGRLIIFLVTDITIRRRISIVPVFVTVRAIRFSVAAYKPEPDAYVFEIRRDPGLLPVAVSAEASELIEMHILMTTGAI